MLGSALAAMVCVLAVVVAAVVAHGPADVTATPVLEERNGLATRRTIYLFPGTKTLTTLELMKVKSTTYPSCLAISSDLAPCSALAAARYYVATPLALDSTATAHERKTPVEEYFSSDAMNGDNRGILPFSIPVVLPVKYEIVTFTSAIVTSTVMHPSITATIQVEGCNPPSLPFEAEVCPPPPAQESVTTEAPTSDDTTVPTTAASTTSEATTADSTDATDTTTAAIADS